MAKFQLQLASLILTPYSPHITDIVTEYDQEIPQFQTTDTPMVPQERATQPSRDTRKMN